MTNIDTTLQLKMNFNYLQTGDILLFKLNGQLFHAAIFAPYDDRASNIIDVTSTKGCARGTLEGLVSSLSAGVSTGNLGFCFNNRLTIHAVRHCYLNGADIADQAEFWRLTQVTYDIHNLLDLTESSWSETMEPNQEANLQSYCSYASRAFTAMIDSPIKPNSLVIFLSILIAPILNLPTMCVSFFINCIRYFQPEKNPGTTCGGFILSVLGAVALKGVNFSDVSACSKRLGSLINVNPDEYHPDLIEQALSNPDTFIQLGELNTNQLSAGKFDRDLFHKEIQADSQAMTGIRSMCLQ